MAEDSNAEVTELFKSKYLRLITFCFLCIWFTMNLVYYGLVLNMNTFGGNIYLNSVMFSNKFNERSKELYLNIFSTDSSWPGRTPCYCNRYVCHHENRQEMVILWYIDDSRSGMSWCCHYGGQSRYALAQNNVCHDWYVLLLFLFVCIPINFSKIFRKIHYQRW